MSPTQRVQAVLDGKTPDRPPFSFWYHFPADQVCGPAAVRAHLDHLDAYGVDFLKVMNDNPYPHAGRITCIQDLSAIHPLAGDEAGFAAQLQLLSDLRAAIAGRVPMITTIFNAWAVLRHLVQPPVEHHPPTYDTADDSPSRWIRTALAQSPHAVEAALAAIGQSLARFASRCIDAGADGIYLSVRDDWVDAEFSGLYRRLVEPLDRAILAAARSARFNMLHVCGRSLDLRRFGQYPVHAINWADRAVGPAIAEVKNWMPPAICGGVNHVGTLCNGTPDDVRRQVADALAQAGNRPTMISPGCTFDPARVPRENLLAIARAAHERPTSPTTA